MTDKVLVEKLPTESNHFIYHLTLNSPKALNALDLDIVDGLHAALDQIEADPDAVCVLLSGAGEKAFCAGGDVRSMYRASQTHPNHYVKAVEHFFTREYQLDYCIHKFAKPILVWADRICMGGGIGLLAGASHRVTTERSKLAMPEVTIGLFPDVGATWFLNAMPDNLGLFFALTGAHINATDAQILGLSDWHVKSERWDGLLNQMVKLHWHADNRDHQVLDQLLSQFHSTDSASMPLSKVNEHHAAISNSINGDDLAKIVSQILALDTDCDWMAFAKQNLQAGSPLTCQIVYRQITEYYQLSLEDCFRLELILACNMSRIGEFAEGVRALLIDKDKNPNWLYPSVDAVPSQVIKQLCEDIEWFHPEPLAMLGC